MNDTTSSSTARADRRAEIRSTMLDRADRRRRTRRLGRTSMMAACLAAAASIGFLAVRPPSAAVGPTKANIVAGHDQTNSPSGHDITPVDTGRVVTRAITDDELVSLLGEAGEEAGLAIINGEARLVRWHAEPESEPPRDTPGSSGRLPTSDGPRTHAAS